MVRQFITYGEERIGYAVRFFPRSQRRIAIHVMPNGEVHVDAPECTDLMEIKTAVRQRARWIWRQLEAQQKRQCQTLPREYVSGETHFYLGRRHMLKVHLDAGAPAEVRLWRGKLEVTVPCWDPEIIRRLLNAWYRERAQDVFARIIFEVAERMRVLRAMGAWRLQAMRTRWGSCSPAGDVLLNPHLVKAPRACIEYVIAHELCHLREHNHSPRFYRLLGAVMPDWESRKIELDNMAEQLLNH